MFKLDIIHQNFHTLLVYWQMLGKKSSLVLQVLKQVSDLGLPYLSMMIMHPTCFLKIEYFN